MKFICNTNESPELIRAQEDLKEFHERRDQRLEFLKKQAKALDEEHQIRWKALFTAAQGLGKIEAGAKYEDHALQISDDDTQLFLRKRREGGMGLGDLLKHLVTE